LVHDEHEHEDEEPKQKLIQKDTNNKEEEKTQAKQGEAAIVGG
jgi:hypothetical protein